MNVEQIADTFHARRVGANWMGRCPTELHVRGDRHASLSIREGRDGRTLIHCWAGCDTSAVLAAVGLRMSDLFAKPSTIPCEPQRPEVAAALSDLRGRLTKRERMLEPVVILTTPENLDLAIVRALALAVEGQEIVQLAFKGAL